mmetsp:Transcript_57853/g.102791  ORF Transcript_57853/g.102791 Transcript_57853/m.102791 type:complete len:364 (-) Transcript_57853:21-1112(-)
MTLQPGIFGRVLNSELAELVCYPEKGSHRQLDSTDGSHDQESVSDKDCAYYAWASVLLSRWLKDPGSWLCAMSFVTLELSCTVFTGDGLFGNLTGGVVESLRLDTGVPMLRHMLGGSLLWALGAFQCLGKRFRHGSLAWLHRTSGRIFLLLWLFVVGPTAAYLSLFCGIGPARAHVSMTFFAIISLDTTLFAYYYFWRAWLLIRRRKGQEALHGQAMMAGLCFTMTILVQRPLQFLVIATRKILLLAAWASPDDWLWTKRNAEGIALNILDHHIGLAVTTAFFGIMLLLTLDGPRSKIMVTAFPLTESMALDLFGSERPHVLELIFWRLRVPFYLLLRALVTNGWASDPIELMAAEAKTLDQS